MANYIQLALAAWLCTSEPFETQVREARPRDPAASVTRVSLDDAPLALDGVTSALQQVPGLQLTRLGSLGAPLWASLRGSSSAQVAVLLDGVPLGGLAQSSVDLNELPWGDIQQVDVYRGVSPLQFGVGAMGGVLAFSTAVPNASQARLGMGYGAFNTAGTDLQGAVQSDGGGSGGSGEDSATLHGGLHAVSSDGDFWFQSDGGTAFTAVNRRDVQRLNNNLVQFSGMLGTQLHRGPQRLRAWLWGLDRDRGVPSLGIRQARNSRVHNSELTANLAYRLLQPGLGSLEVQAYAQGVLQRFVDPLAEVLPYPSNAQDRSGLLGLRSFASGHLLPGWQLSAVLQGRYETQASRDALAKPPEGATATRWLGSLGLESDVAVGPVHLLPSVLLEGANDQRAGRDPFGHFATAKPYTARLWHARLGAWQAPAEGLTVRANAARYARLPSALELYGNSQGVLGNAALLPESGVNADLSAAWERPADPVPWRLDASLFATFSQDLITFEQNTAGLARAINLGQARILGADMATQAAPWPWLQVALQGTYMHARDASATPQGRAAVLLPGRPQWHVRAQPALHAGWLRAHIELDWVAGAYLDPANLVPLPDRFTLGASVGARVADCDIALRGQNLLDARAFDVAGFPLPSRSLMLTLRWQSHGDA